MSWLEARPTIGDQQAIENPALAAATRTLAVYRARLDTILDAAHGWGPALAHDDPAQGARCAQGDPDRPGSGWLTCGHCPMNPDHGALAIAANSLCRGIAHWWRQRLVVARLAGDTECAAECEAALAPPDSRQDDRRPAIAATVAGNAVAAAIARQGAGHA